MVLTELCQLSKSVLSFYHEIFRKYQKIISIELKVRKYRYGGGGGGGAAEPKLSKGSGFENCSDKIRFFSGSFDCESFRLRDSFGGGGGGGGACSAGLSSVKDSNYIVLLLFGQINLLCRNFQILALVNPDYILFS